MLVLWLRPQSLRVGMEWLHARVRRAGRAGLLSLYRRDRKLLFVQELSFLSWGPALRCDGPLKNSDRGRQDLGIALFVRP